MKKCCLYFNGNGSEVQVPNTSDLLNGKTAATLECWYKMEERPGENRGLLGWRNESDSDFYILHYGNEDKWEMRIRTTDGKFDLNPIFANYGSWNHLVFVRDGSISKVYFNGQEVASRNDISGTWSTSSNFHVGLTPTVIFYYKGYVDEVRFYDRALQESEILASWNSGKGGPPANPSGLKIWLNFNEGGGTITHDVSGNENHGIIDKAIWITGFALDFDGESDYVLVPHNNLLNIGEGNKITITLKAYLTGWQVNHSVGVIIDKRTEKQANYNWEFDDLNMKMRVHAGGETYEVLVPHSLNTWNFYTMVLNGDVLKGYLNGEEKDTVTGVATSDTNIEDLHIGEATGGNFRIKGMIDEIRIYNRVLSETEIQTLYRGENVSKGLVLWLPFNEGGGTIAYDHSGENNNGTLYGPIWASLDSPPWLRYFKIRIVPK